MYTYKATVLRVIDGDTIECMIDCGFYTFTKQHIRLLGVDAPETRTKDLEEKKRGLATKMFLSSLIEGKEVIIETRLDKTFDRFLGTVYLETDGDSININKFLIDEGYAIPHI